MLGRVTLMLELEAFDHYVEWRWIGTGKAFKEAKGEQVKYHIDHIILNLFKFIIHIDGCLNMICLMEY